MKIEGKLRGFEQLGVDWRTTIGEQAIGDCPFCGSESKLYAHTTKHLWDCKVCGESGNWQGFLNTVAEYAKTKMNRRMWSAILQHRGLPRSMLKHLDIGFWNGRITLPVRNDDGNVKDIRLWWPNQQVRGIASAGTGLWGADTMADARRVFVCEGEWDGHAVSGVVHASDDGDTAVVAVPGAQTFKTEWCHLFDGKDVVLLYDHDGAGERGRDRAINLLAGHARSIQVIEWPASFPVGGDMRDFVVDLLEDDTPVADILAIIERTLTDASSGPSRTAVPTTTRTSDRAAPHSDVEPLDADGVYREYLKWLRLPDPDVLSVLFGALWSNRLAGDPTWLFLIAMSGGAKSQLLMSLAGIEDTYAVSSLTPASLVSGAISANGTDPSLLPKFDGKTVLVKDFTTVLKMQQEDRGRVFSILRDAYDGNTSKEFGTGVRREYDVKFSMIAAVTPAIDAYASQDAGLGERFLKFRVPPVSREEMRAITRRAIENIDADIEMQEALSQTAARAMAWPTPDESPVIPDAMFDKFVALAEYTSVLRGVVLKDRFTREQLARPIHESPTRIARQLAKHAKGMAQFHRSPVVTERELRIAAKIAHDTVSDRVGDIIHALAGQDEPVSSPWLSKATALPRSTLYGVTDDLVRLNVLEQVEHGKQTRLMLAGHLRELYSAAPMLGDAIHGTQAGTTGTTGKAATSDGLRAPDGGRKKGLRARRRRS